MHQKGEDRGINRLAEDAYREEGSTPETSGVLGAPKRPSQLD